MISLGIADDDALVRRTLSELLDAQDDFTVAWSASDGQEALDLLHSAEQPPVDALLLDNKMPRVDGLVVAQTLQAEGYEIAVLILTNYIADDVIDRAMAAGVRGFIAKEDSIATMAGAIRQAVGGNIILSPASFAVLGERLAQSVPISNTATHAAIPQPAALVPDVMLSPRECEVLNLMVDALSNKQIARCLGISEATVKTHVSTVIAKLGVQDRVAAVVYAVRRGLA